MSKRIGLVIYPGFQVLDTAVLSVFEFANTLLEQPLYELATLSATGGPVRSSSSVAVDSQPLGWGGYDTLLVGGAIGIPAPQPELESTLRNNAGATRRIASICTGAFILARTGLMDGKRATTHWAFGRRLQEQHPALVADEDKIFVREGNIWSSAGVTACIDMALAMVEEDLGIDIARKVARAMVVYHRRTGGQSQFSAIAEIEPSSDRVKEALLYARDNLHKELSVDELAARVHWSPRHFSRVFQAQTGMAPAKAIEKLRVEAAQELIEQGHSSIGRIAGMTGFGDEERMRRAFLRAFGQPPKMFVHQARQRNEHVYLS
ncbi:transcriptional regulator GlxA family with amidase domain [Pseudoduganella lurida]|uniref:Transcriptional regulator GlxA family with amidase domain n=1 Tax=Pseudoduganella lurida TaxID=1036180 RepID=A0A562R1X1_9BURK|nr:GlxA family transcriptional regulator [Pseudoduganella lurida]TWI63072.1 transcriptional regulator GlxA family with amidase domain [Pseudoduganella lurida]